MEDMFVFISKSRTGWRHVSISKSRTEWRTCFHKQEQNRMEDMFVFISKSRTEWRTCLYL